MRAWLVGVVLLLFATCGFGQSAPASFVVSVSGYNGVDDGVYTLVDDGQGDGGYFMSGDRATGGIRGDTGTPQTADGFTVFAYDNGDGTASVVLLDYAGNGESLGFGYDSGAVWGPLADGGSGFGDGINATIAGGPGSSSVTYGPGGSSFSPGTDQTSGPGGSGALVEAFVPSGLGPSSVLSQIASAVTPWAIGSLAIVAVFVGFLVVRRSIFRTGAGASAE